MRALMLRLLLAFLAITASASAQGGDRRTILIEGAADIEVSPDIVTLILNVSTEGRNQAETFREHEQDVARVLTAVRRFGIPDRDIDILAVSFNTSGRDASARRTIRVQSDSLRIVPDLVAAVVQAGVDNIGGVEYGLQDRDAAEDRALDAAVARAYAKAQLMAEATGARLGAVRAMRESNVPQVSPLNMRGGRSREVVFQGASVGAAYAAGDQTVSARVVIEYDLIAE